MRLLVALTALAFEFRRRYPYFTIGWFWYLGTLVPMIGLVQVGLQQMADRYAYFPFLGLYLALGGFVTSRRAAVAVVGVYGILGFVQTGYWHDTLTLLDHTASVTRDNSFVRLASATVSWRTGVSMKLWSNIVKPLLLRRRIPACTANGRRSLSLRHPRKCASRV